MHIKYNIILIVLKINKKIPVHSEKGTKAVTGAVPSQKVFFLFTL